MYKFGQDYNPKFRNNLSLKSRMIRWEEESHHISFKKKKSKQILVYNKMEYYLAIKRNEVLIHATKLCWYEVEHQWTFKTLH